MFTSGLLFWDRHHVLTWWFREQVFCAIFTGRLLELRYMMLLAMLRILWLHQTHVTIALMLRLIVGIELVLQIVTTVRASECIGRGCGNHCMEATWTVLALSLSFILARQWIQIVWLLYAQSLIGIVLADLLAYIIIFAQLLRSWRLFFIFIITDR